MKDTLTIRVCTAVDNEITRGIIREVYVALYNLGADPDLLAAVGSWGDTLDDEMVLKVLKLYNQQRGKK